MPTVLRDGPYSFVFFSSDRGEPPHIHVLKDDKQLKIWLKSLVVARRVGFADHDVNAILKIAHERQAGFLEAWNDHFES